MTYSVEAWFFWRDVVWLVLKGMFTEVSASWLARFRKQELTVTGCANVHKMIIMDRSIGLNSGLVTTCYHCIEQSFPKFVISMCSQHFVLA